MITQSLAEVMCDEIRRHRDVLRRAAMAWSWDKAYDAETIEWLHRTIQAAIRENGDPCNDNERAADWSKRAERKRYEKVRAHGCCGSYDEFVTAPDGRKFRIGFNYGH